MSVNGIDRRTLLRLAGGGAAGALAAAALPAATGGAKAAAAGEPLTWRPPTLTNPVTLTLGTGRTSNTLDNTKDYIINLPKAIKNGSTVLRGGRNVVVIGGHVTLPAYGSDANTGRAIHIEGNVGTVHLEGIYVDTTENGQGDALAINAPDSIVQVENCRFAGLKGAYDTSSYCHSDVIQPWGGVSELRVDKLTGTSNYQGLFLPKDLGAIGTVSINRTNIEMLPEWFTGAKGGYALWISEEPNYFFSDLYVEPRSGRTLGKSVWPDVDSATHPVVISGGYGSWPSMPNVTGGVHTGSPAGGDYVPEGVAGYGYVSPGYL